jgi:hypothetical protein
MFHHSLSEISGLERFQNYQLNGLGVSCISRPLLHVCRPGSGRGGWINGASIFMRMKLITGVLWLLLCVSHEACCVTLAWDAPTNNVDGSPLTDLAGYKVYFGHSSRTYSAYMDVGNVTLCQFTNLQPGATYFFATTAYNADGVESDVSAELSYSVPDSTPPVISACPVGLDADATGGAVIPDMRATALVSDDVSPQSDIIVTQTPVPGTRVGLGVSAVTLTATDLAGNRSMAKVAVTVSDTAPPSVSAGPVSLTVDATGFTFVPNIAVTAVVSDNCTPVTDILVAQQPCAGTRIGAGITSVVLTATDLAGNRRQITDTVTVAKTPSQSVSGKKNQVSPVVVFPRTTLSVASCMPKVLNLHMTATNGWVYTLQATSSLVPASWMNVPPYTNLVGSGDWSFLVTNGVGTAGTRFYRIIVAAGM